MVSEMMDKKIVLVPYAFSKFPAPVITMFELRASSETHPRRRESAKTLSGTLRSPVFKALHLRN